MYSVKISEFTLQCKTQDEKLVLEMYDLFYQDKICIGKDFSSDNMQIRAAECGYPAIINAKILSEKQLMGVFPRKYIPYIVKNIISLGDIPVYSFYENRIIPHIDALKSVLTTNTIEYSYQLPKKIFLDTYPDGCRTAYLPIALCVRGSLRSIMRAYNHEVVSDTTMRERIFDLM